MNSTVGRKFEDNYFSSSKGVVFRKWQMKKRWIFYVDQDFIEFSVLSV